MKLAAAILYLSTAINAEPTYEPGNFSAGATIEGDGDRKIYLSNGLMGEAIAHSGRPVQLADGTTAKDADGNELLYHDNCDGGAAIPKTDESGYYYVSNSEIGNHQTPELIGGVYSLEFNNEHELLGYTKVLGETAKNCHGGETPWGTWVSCEESREHGRCWQVDPTGATPSKKTAVTGQGDELTPHFGNWEAFAWDNDDKKGYVTNDDYPNNKGYDESADHSGAIARYTPDADALACLDADAAADKWCALESGTVDYLKLNPEGKGSTGTFEWVALEDSNPELYGGSEGAHVEGGIFTFSTIVDRYLFRLDLGAGTYVRSAVPFPFEPDNLRVLKDGEGEDTVYLCTDGDDQPGDAVWGWDDEGAYRMLYEESHSYPAGVDFSTDRKNMYVSLYGHTTYRFWRSDGMGFDEPAKSVKYEVDGGIDEGMTHADIFQQYNGVYDYENPAVIEVADAGSTASDATVGSEDEDDHDHEDEDDHDHEDEDDHDHEDEDDHDHEDEDDHDHDHDAEDAATPEVQDTPSGAASSAMAAGTVVGALAGALVL